MIKILWYYYWKNKSNHLKNGSAFGFPFKNNLEFKLQQKN